ncbi:hypothetical protein jhhlp_002319 [Lomentospora prolificans]|uniref:Exonuclease domain-containing protein n=1 Tax=Lomentospora prolificans TaxID=41688 RepID=A0A2N3NDN9_9PEZI|nr:hypothetical protein jhhlp_002319 [Lomentospora prolificans]
MSQKSTPEDGPLVWIDCEMTGLDPSTDEILEIHCQITSPTLRLLDPAGYTAIIHFPASRLDQMSEWCRTTHAATGLTPAVIASTTTPEQAAAGLLHYIRRFAPEPRTALLAGNSVHMDKMFLMKAPYASVLEHLHYRILDVSAIKEAARRWCPQDVADNVPVKKGGHRAKDDILESIEEARYYMEKVFAPAGKSS